MSEFSNDFTKAFIPNSDFNPGHQLPGQSFVVQQKTDDDAPAASSPDMARMQQLDAGVMQTLNLQAKLAIGAPGDKYEQEADQVASQVVERMNAPQAQQKSVQREAMPEDEEETVMAKPLGTSIQREAMPEDEEETVMAKPLGTSIQREAMPEDEEETVMAKPLGTSIQREAMPEEEEQDVMMKPLQRQSATGGGTASADLESSIEGARGQGHPLGDNVRGSMEDAFGADFSGVRVHTGSESHGLNESIQARAFTTGQDIFFRQGEYQPDNQGGQELLAHELTHVVQQNGSAVQAKKQS